MPKERHYALKQEYPNLTSAIVFNVDVFDTGTQSGITVSALWDTGATGSAISPAAAKTLNLLPVDKVSVTGVHGVEITDVVLVDVGLPNGVKVKEINASVCNLTGFDFLIGMNIILLGDFCVSNGGGKTLFSFAIPSFENKTDLYEKALAVNKRNKY